ncbi:hypothetical protein BKA69DRAFT_465663 [Paraphysoderma sedebokerense]|nr:hypothetical protein BKA69DRAFT_465663 [Paraphysoderma sedebokerense]
MDSKSIINDSALQLTHANVSLANRLKERAEQQFTTSTYWDLSRNYLNHDSLTVINEFLNNRRLNVLDLTYNYINLEKIPLDVLQSLAEKIGLIVLIGNYLGFSSLSSDFEKWWKELKDKNIETKLVILDDLDAWAVADDVRQVLQTNYRRYVEIANVKVLSRYGTSSIGSPSASNRLEGSVKTPIEFEMGTPIEFEEAEGQIGSIGELESRVSKLEVLTESLKAKQEELEKKLCEISRGCRSPFWSLSLVSVFRESIRFIFPSLLFELFYRFRSYRSIGSR